MDAPSANRLGCYLLHDRIGEGGEGTVWKAQCAAAGVPGVAVGDWVALKVLKNPGDSLSPQVFQRQAALLLELDHPNIIRYRDAFVVHGAEDFSETCFCLVTEFLEGQTLRARVEATGGVPWEEARAMVRDVLQALLYLGRTAGGVIHRDLKLSNLFLTTQGTVKIIDFGIARPFDPRRSGTTSDGLFKGSFDYMAPEYAIERDRFRGDERSEIFSFGVCFYHLLTGRLPFPAIPPYSPMAFVDRWQAPVPPALDIRPGSLRLLKNAGRFVHRCLEPQVAARFQTFAAVAEEFAHVEPRRLVSASDTYVFRRYLGKGGFGQVYQATRQTDGRPVAIKVLFESMPAKRFLAEAEMLRRLRHPQLVEYVDFATELVTGVGERHCLVLEYLEGMPEGLLRNRIRETHTGMDPDEVLKLFVGYLDCLEYLHGQGVYHRDLKPANLYAPRGQPENAKVFDLGIARQEDGTRTYGFVPGTLNYMAPELVLSGNDRGSTRSDLFALGVSLYEALTRNLPFGPLPPGEKEAIEAYCARSTKPCEAYDAALRLEHDVFRRRPRLAEAIRQALRCAPESRYASAADLRAVLADILAEGDPSEAPTTGTEATTVGAGTTATRWEPPPADPRLTPSAPRAAYKPVVHALVGEGRYRLLRPLGEPGSELTWLAADEEQSEDDTPVQVVVKFVPAHAVPDHRSLKALQKEAFAAEQLKHPHIARLIELHEAPDEPLFWLSEFVPGTSLQEWLAGQPGGRFTADEIQPVLIQLWEALEHAHAKDVFHRELEPDKILITSDRRVKIVGFGMSSPVRSDQAADSPYVSPERRQGRGHGATDDIFSLGRILYLLVTGRLPAAEARPPSLPEAAGLPFGDRRLPRIAARETILRAADPDPRLRPPSLVAFRSWWVNGPPPPPENPPPASLGQPLAEIRDPGPPSAPSTVAFPWFKRLFVLGLLVAGAAGVGLWRGLPRPPREKTTAVPPQAPSTNPGGGAAVESGHKESHPVAVLQLRFTDAKPAPIYVEILTNEAPAATPQTRTPALLRYQTATGETLTLTNLPPGRHRIDAGTTIQHQAGTWTRQTVELFAGQLANLSLSLKPSRLEILLSDPVAVSVHDGWGNLVAELGVNSLERGLWGHNAETVWRTRPDTGAFRALLPGDYRVQLLERQPDSSRQFEAVDVVRRLVPAPNNLPLTLKLALVPAKSPRLTARWTNSLGSAFLPVGGAPPFLAARTETTVDEFAAFARATGFVGEDLSEITQEGVVRRGRTWRQALEIKRTNHPVVGVSWNEARAFCDWLTQSEREAGRLGPRQRYDLPTDAQWSLLVGTTRFPWGPDYPPTVDQGNYAGQEVKHGEGGGWPANWESFLLSSTDTNWARTTPVGLRESEPNRFADLGGNAAEWCRDLFHAGLYRPEDWIVKPRRLTNALAATMRVVRGGAWRDHDPDMLRSGTRWAEPEQSRTDWLGFRIVLEEEP